MLAMGFGPDLQAVRLAGRFDPLHLASLRARPASERLALALSADRLAVRLREQARLADGATG